MMTGNRSKEDLTDKRFWDTNWDQVETERLLQPFSAYKFCRFHRLFDKYLPKGNNDFRLLEVGCVPGRHMVYFNKVFGYRVEGVDFSEHIAFVHKVMKYHKVQDYSLYQADFLSFDHSPYDAVVSFGFLEHFIAWPKVLEKHMDLVKPGGYLVVSVPNLCYMQYILHKLLDPMFEKEQVVASTKLGNIEALVKQAGFDLLYSGYYQTFHFFCHHRKHPRDPFRGSIIQVLRIIGAFFTRCRINIPSRFLSPQVICIAVRNEQE